MDPHQTLSVQIQVKEFTSYVTASYLVSLCLSFLIYKIEILMIFPYPVLLRIKITYMFNFYISTSIICVFSIVVVAVIVIHNVNQ